MAATVQDAAVRVLGGVVAGLVIVAGGFEGSLRWAAVVGLVVGLGYALAAAAVVRFGGS